MSRTRIFYYALVGISGGLFCWSLVSLLNIFIKSHVGFHSIIVGGAIGIVYGFILSLNNQLFFFNKIRFLKFALFSTICGVLVGAITFFIIHMVNPYKGIAPEFIQNTLIIFQNWVLLFLIIGASPNLFEKNFVGLTPSIFVSLCLAVIFSVLISFFYYFLKEPFIMQGITFIAFGGLVSMGDFLKNNFFHKSYLRFLNGELAGLEYRLTQGIITIGDQKNDHIRLKNYIDISPNHAKILNYGELFSLLDNDSFNRTWVNFRPITECTLKDGDVIKIGSIELQFIK